ncbi:serine protease gd-like, partial [Condylostylus longicornis]|uniref:serine protease gd-like n=1 Tax=Condylostylus longicornis TaxID=2530218 RepID=UPI00244E2508
SSGGPVSCGTTTVPVNLIFGGKKMKPGSWPWLTAIFVNDKGRFTYICAGNLISPQGIITAAHCVTIPGGIRNPQDIRIGLGIYNIDNWNDPNAQIAGVSNVIPHPEYSRQKIYDADIAVIILDRPYSYTNFVRPVCMWRDEFGTATDREGQVAGWGLAKPNGGSEKEPSIVEARIVSDQKCLRSNDAFGTITSERNLCAGYRDDTGPCQGDSGSGLIIDIGGKWFLRATVSGAISHVQKVCDLKQYVIYTDVAQFSNWISQYIRF